jgi:hypothetical protein
MTFIEGEITIAGGGTLVWADQEEASTPSTGRRRPPP